MSPKYSLALVLAVTLFLTATSDSHDPSILPKNELAVPKKPPGNGTGHVVGSSNNNELAANVNPRKGHGPDPKEPHVNKEAVLINDRKSKAGEYHVAKNPDPSNPGGKHRPGDAADTRFNENKARTKPGNPDHGN